MIPRNEIIWNHYARVVAFWMLWGFAISLHNIRKGKKVKFIDFLIEILLAWIIARTVDLIAPDTRVLQNDPKTYWFAVLIGMLNNWGTDQIVEYAKKKFSKLLS